MVFSGRILSYNASGERILIYTIFVVSYVISDVVDQAVLLVDKTKQETVKHVDSSQNPNLILWAVTTF